MNVQVDSTGTALYFPNFAPDDSWLKCSLLYWDRVRRIVPDAARESVENEDSSVASEATKSRLLISTDCARYKDAAAQRFHSQLVPLIQGANGLASRWLKREVPKVNLHGDKIGQIQTTWLHSQKIPDDLSARLITQGLFRRQGDQVAMPAAAGALYMTCLAAEMSESIGTPVLTDEPELAKGSAQIMYIDKSFTQVRDGRCTLLQRLGVRFPHRNAMKSVSLDSVIKFREKFAAERIAFRQTLDTFVAELAMARDVNRRDDLIASKRQEIAAQMKDHRLRLKDLGIIGLWSFMTLSVPTAILALPEEMEQYATRPVLAVAGLALGLAATWAQIRGECNRLVAGNSWHYAIRLQRRFK